jgi:predicted acylesterase/phospholipase RssA
MSNNSKQPAHKIALACQGGGSHAAFAAGALKVLLPEFVADDHEPEGEPHELVAISGTSGGALCALAAWYGLIKGGTAEAVRLLDRLWDANCAQTPGETFFNQLALFPEAWPWQDVAFNPYLPPLSPIELATTRLWPALARLSPLLAGWVRPDFFRLEALIDEIIDDQGFVVIGEIGRFWSILRLIQRWRVARRAKRIGDGSMAADEPEALAEAIVERLAFRAALERTAERWPGGLLAATLNRAGRPAAFRAALDEPAMDKIEHHVRDITRGMPELLLGAVDIEHGNFIAFSSAKAPHEFGITRDSALASAALPWLFQAVTIPLSGPLDPEDPLWRRGRHSYRLRYWDGLLSQNPPLRNFTADLVDHARKPDEIVIVQINPAGFADPGHVLHSRIWDRRNQLAGNLSLNQEAAFLDAVNRRATRGSGETRSDGEDDKGIQVVRLTLDLKSLEEDLGRQLGALSKFDRDPLLKEKLVIHGVEQAVAFLVARRLFRYHWSEGTLPPELPRTLANDLSRVAKALDVEPPVTVDDIAFSREARGDGSEWRILAHWHTQVRPKMESGTAVLMVRDGALVDGSLKDVRLTRMRLARAPRARQRGNQEDRPQEVAVA